MALSQPTIIDSTEAQPTAADIPAAAPRVEQYVPILSGETLEDVAAKYQTDVQTIVDRNQLNPGWYFANQWVFV